MSLNQKMPLKRHKNANKKCAYDKSQKCKQNYLINAYGIDSGCIYCTGLGYLEWCNTNINYPICFVSPKAAMASIAAINAASIFENSIFANVDTILESC